MIPYIFGGIAAVIIVAAAVFIAPLFPGLNPWIFAIIVAVLLTALCVVAIEILERLGL